MRHFSFYQGSNSCCLLLAEHIQVSSFTADPGTEELCPAGAAATVNTFKQLYLQEMISLSP